MTELSIKDAKQLKALNLARNNFWVFRLLLHKRLKIGWWQKEISDNLNQFYLDYLSGKRPQLIITSPPQHGKSTIINDFLLWIIGKDSETDNKDLKILFSSFSDALSTRANRMIQRLTLTKRYLDIFPNYKPIYQTQALILFGEDGYFRNTTVGGAITGESGDVMVIDDPVKGREAANSETIRNKTWEWFTSDFKTRFSEHAAFLMILTRWHIDDLAGRLIDADDTVNVLKYSAIAENNELNRSKGEPLFPEHKSLEFLLGIKKIIPAATWNSLYQQNPTIAEGNFFKPDFMPIIETLPSELRFVRAWDLAATENDGDYTIGLFFGYDEKNQIGYVGDVRRGQWGVENVEKILKNTADLDGKRVKIKLPQDPAQAGKSQAKNLAKLLAGFDVDFQIPSGDKETRAKPVAAQVNVGNICLVKGAWNRAFIEELRLFPNGVNDDQIDAFSDAYNHFVNSDNYATDGFIAVPRHEDDYDYYR